MHNNFYFLRQLSAALEKELKGTVISECFSQNKDELVIRFETATIPFLIKASLSPQLSALSFPKEFNRARKNSIDLFDTIIGRRVHGLRQFSNERSFALLLSDNITVLFKMHGNKANVLVFEGVTPPLLFKNSLVADSKIILYDLDRMIDWSYEAFLSNQSNLVNHFFTFGKEVWKYLQQHGFETKTEEEKWKSIVQIHTKLEQTTDFFVTEWDGKIVLTLFQAGNVKRKHSDPIEAANDFFYTSIHAKSFDDRKQNLISSLLSKLQSATNYYKKTSAKLIEVENNNNYKIWADLIMANMHQIPVGADKITVENFYNENKPIEIKLRKDQPPQKNAETFYRKAKNQQIEIDKLKETLANKQKEINNLESQLTSLRASQSLKDLSEFSKEKTSREKSKEAEPLPYHEFIFKGYKIWVGRNSDSNDVLTQKFSYKEDLWLHAKDVAGSHVLIKYQAGKNFPKDVIERAAELAAYNSKRKNDSLCPVIVTPKKFVRKRKGDPAGAVVVEREQIILVVPNLSGLQ
ncbi:MAG TPA: NFACT RNA binding domain-containing protein [Chryseosolibacter sp.]